MKNLTIKIVWILAFMPALAFAQHQGGPPPLGADEEAALQACGISKPERDERMTREEHEAHRADVKYCLNAAGFTMNKRNKGNCGDDQSAD